MNSLIWSFPIVSGRSTPVRCFSWATCLAAALAAVLGCSENTSIRQYRVAKKETQRTTAAQNIGSTAAPAKEQLMLAAIVPNKDFAWFFKLTGDPEVVLKNDPEFRSIVKSVAFDGSGQPTWKLHEGWQQQITPNDITYGKLTNSKAGLTATVTRLPFTSNATEESWRGYIVSNINRWRNQLSLDKQEWAQMSAELEEFPELSQGPAKAYFVSISGKGSGGMSAPFMNRGARAQAAEGTSQATESPSSPSLAAGSDQAHSAAENEDGEGKVGEKGGDDEKGRGDEKGESDAERRATLKTDSVATDDASAKPITYTVPKAWSETPASGMRMAAFAITEGDSTGEVTVIAAGGGIEANIGIWLGQVGAEANAELTQRILAAAEELMVDGVAAKLYTIDGAVPPASEAKPEEAASAAQAILIVDIPWRDGQSLFVKYKGPQALAQSQRQAFVEFAKSIEWN